MTESAVPEHLAPSRIFSTKLKPGYIPPYPTYTSRFPFDQGDVVIVILGSQHEEPGRDESPSTLHERMSLHAGKSGQTSRTASRAAESALQRMINFVTETTEASKPKFYELASHHEDAGFYEQCIVAYWDTKLAYNEWEAASGFEKWWKCLDPAIESHGWFLEVFLPPLERFENAFTSPTVLEGAAHLQENVSGAIQEHGYWGSMRDRLPISQTDLLEGDKAPDLTLSMTDSKARRIRVRGRKNLAVIRSGQDWSAVPDNERKLYLETMHPILMAGMKFLHDEGLNLGCLSCRFMDVLDRETWEVGTQKTFGPAYFDNLGSLETWSMSHETHKRIYGGFFRYAKELQNNMSLRFFREVFVLEPEQQVFEYVNCHSKTGVLAAL